MSERANGGANGPVLYASISYHLNPLWNRTFRIHQQKPKWWRWLRHFYAEKKDMNLLKGVAANQTTSTLSVAPLHHSKDTNGQNQSIISVGRQQKKTVPHMIGLSNIQFITIWNHLKKREARQNRFDPNWLDNQPVALLLTVLVIYHIIPMTLSSKLCRIWEQRTDLIKSDECLVVI